MKKRLFALLLASQSVMASEWIALPDTGTDQYFYDNSKLVIKDDEITYWKKVVFKAPQTVKGREVASGILRERINCAEHTAQQMSYLYYSTAGETIDFLSQEDAPASPVIPDTIGDTYDRVLCPKVWRKQEEVRIKAEQLATESELKKPAPKKEENKSTVPTSVRSTPPQLPNVRLPPKEAATPPLPMPQIMEQLY